MLEERLKIQQAMTAVSDNFLAEIGRITVHFALLEWHLIALTHKLIGVPENISRPITCELSFRGLQQLAASLVRARFPEKTDQLDQLLSKVSRVEERRNTITHSLWGSGSLNKDREQVVVRTKFTAKQKHGLRLAREELTVEDLQKIAHDISIAIYDVERFYAVLIAKGPHDT